MAIKKRLLHLTKKAAGYSLMPAHLLASGALVILASGTFFAFISSVYLSKKIENLTKLG